MKEDLIRTLPTKRISPFDGMTVTAEAWAAAHDYHTYRQRAYAAFAHGAGILTGLQVIASDPPDTSVYILPGLAVDAEGQIIALTEPALYDLGKEIKGLLYLMITFGEGQPRADDEWEGAPLYIREGFSIQAETALSAASGVELARIRRRSEDAPLHDAQDAEHPGENEIDLRFRREIGASEPDCLGIAISYAGGTSLPRHGRGADALARALRGGGHDHGGRRIWVDDQVSLASSLEPYALIYLVGQRAFQMDSAEMNALYTLIQKGGTVLIESCHQESNKPPADASFSDLLGSLGIKLEPLTASSAHRLFSDPLLFPALPAGFETEGTPGIMVGDGVIFSTCDYGCLWQGERRGRTATREEVRSATEWGHNLIAYALERRRKAQNRP